MGAQRPTAAKQLPQGFAPLPERRARESFDHLTPALSWKEREQERRSEKIDRLHAGEGGEGVISISIAIPISSSIPEPPPPFATAPARRPAAAPTGPSCLRSWPRAEKRFHRDRNRKPSPCMQVRGGSETPIACGLSIFCAARCLLRFPLLPGEDEGEVMSSGRAAPDSGEATATRICAVAGTEGSRVVRSPHPGPLLEGEGARAPIRENRQTPCGGGLGRGSSRFR